METEAVPKAGARVLITSGSEWSGYRVSAQSKNLGCRKGLIFLGDRASDFTFHHLLTHRVIENSHLGSTKPRPTTATRQRPTSGKAKLSSSYSLPDLKQSSVDNSSSASSSAASPPFRPAGRSRPPGLPPPLPSHRTPLIRRPSAESSLVVSSYGVSHIFFSNMERVENIQGY